MHSNNSSMIEVRNIAKRFGSVTALDNIRFSVSRGELFFLLGPSGCGKTTMLRILAGLETQDKGSILYNGKDVAELPPHKRGAPMVFQNYALWPHMSVYENVAFGLVESKTPKKEIVARVNQALEQVNLFGMGNRMPNQLSGGQQQRVVLARALVMNPHTVLLDEPLSNLDAKLRSEMREEIEALHKNTDITFIYVTHDQIEALSLADRMAMMDNGKICAIGTPSALYHRPPSLFCATFLGEANALQGTVLNVVGNMVITDTAIGKIKAVYQGNTPTIGTSVNCIIRPENIRIDGAGDNSAQAIILSSRMTGATTTLLLDVNGTILRAVMLNEYGSNPAAGTMVTAVFKATDTIVVTS
ncbi:MAG: ABC transporter ATP-binding protein [Lentisphaerae bacterium]|nr:ABC transporter ATP-binding protein [Lentisphaerota bacterium]